MSETPTLISQIEQIVSAKLTSFLSFWGGMVGGSATAAVAKIAQLGEPDIVAGVGVLMAIFGFILKTWHNYAQRRLSERIEYAKMTPEQRQIFDNN